jgi:hypothetical protein
MSQVTEYTKSSKYPIRFDRLHPGSLFSIVSEPSRHIRKSTDNRIYRKAQDHEGFYAVSEIDGSAAVLFPYDQVQPLRILKVIS